jgi:hypothetical protein
VKYFLLLALTVAVWATAQTVTVRKPLTCAPTSEVVTTLIGSDYKERPIWMGSEPSVPPSRYSLFVNDETKTWTLIQFDEKIACVLGTGEASTELFTGPKI